jgi:hypothetical protein
MPASKIVDHSEVERWFDEGKTYPEMREIYLSKYNIETSTQMWSNYGRRRGRERRSAWDADLVPWAVAPEHRRRYAYIMLTTEARVRAGKEVPQRRLDMLNSWKEKLRSTGTVITYEPELEPYFFPVPARPGIDTDLVRVPDRKERHIASD